MAVKPLDDRVLVKQSEAEERTAGGIVLPGCGKGKTPTRENHRHGPGKNASTAENAVRWV